MSYMDMEDRGKGRLRRGLNMSGDVAVGDLLSIRCRVLRCGASTEPSHNAQ
jgi:hypothetical protein